MPSVSRATVIGHVGRDPEIRTTSSGESLASFSVACSDRRKDKATSQVLEETTWHNVTAFGTSATYCAKHLVKGALVYVEGRLRTRKWTAQDGTERERMEILADQVHFLRDKSAANTATTAPVVAPLAPPAPSRAAVRRSLAELDDDIPF